MILVKRLIAHYRASFSFIINWLWLIFPRFFQRHFKFSDAKTFGIFGDDNSWTSSCFTCNYHYIDCLNATLWNPVCRLYWFTSIFCTSIKVVIFSSWIPWTRQTRRILITSMLSKPTRDSSCGFLTNLWRPVMGRVVWKLYGLAKIAFPIVLFSPGREYPQHCRYISCNSWTTSYITANRGGRDDPPV